MNLFTSIPYHVQKAMKTVPGGTPALQDLENGFDPGIESGCSGTELPPGGTVSSAMESAFWHHPPRAHRHLLRELNQHLTAQGISC